MFFYFAFISAGGTLGGVNYGCMAACSYAGGLPILGSFAYGKGVEHVLTWLKDGAFPRPPAFLLDSGAFTAHTTGRPIKLKEYLRFIEKHQPSGLIDYYMALDVIGDVVATDKNLRKMLKAGFSPIPVFQLPSRRWDLLDAYLAEHEYIAVGGIAGRDVPLEEKRALLSETFRRNATLRRRIHGFGVTDVRLLMEFPFYSVDSSSPLSAVKFGGMGVYRQDPPGISTVDPHSEACREAIVRAGALKDFRPVGDSPPSGAWSPGGGYLERLEHTLRAYAKLISVVTAIWSARGVTWEVPHA